MEDDDDEDLFEIDLELVNCISSSPSKPHYYNTATTSTTNSNYSTGKKNALLANCLMPISDISSAIPACNKSKNISSNNNNYNVVISESFSLEEYLRLPFLGDIGALLHGKTKPQFQFQFHH
ncbi:hypothetical protein AAHE18_02G194300 [Arachis hypogaea]